MRLKSGITLVFSLLLSVIAFAQKAVEGKVTDAKTGEPMSNVSVNVVGTNNGTSTDSKGHFSIKVGNLSTGKLGFTHVGYKSHFVELEGKTSIEVKLQPLEVTMEDVVVIGYGTVKKSHLTGSVSKFKNDRLDETPMPSLDQALQGKIAGVNIQNTSSEAGAAPRIRVRGLSSINASADPLVVIDGQPVPDGLAFLNMADVESVEVLKDAASAAIYGSRAAGGVIMVTTKKGKADKPKYTVKASWGKKSAYKLHPIMTITDYTNLLYAEAALREKDPNETGTKNKINNNERAAYILETQILGNAVDWQDLAVRSANTQNIQFGISGGKKESQYYISGNYQKDEGIMYHSSTEKISLRGRIDNQLSKKVSLSLNLNPSYTKTERPGTNYIDFYRFYSFMPPTHNDVSAAFVNQLPGNSVKPGDWAHPTQFNNLFYSGYMPDGTFWSGAVAQPFNSSNNNPKSLLETRNIFTNQYRMLGSADLKINLAKGLDFKTSASGYINYNDGFDFTMRNSKKKGDPNVGVATNQLYIDLLSENTLNYSKTIKDHSFSAMAGFTAEKTLFRINKLTGMDLPSDNIRTLNNALTINKDSSYTKRNQVGLLSWLGRVNYSFKDKYLFSASFRADGSSYFAPGHKWGYFPSASLGWVVSNEEFMKDVDWINQLKLRGSYGVTGNNRIQDFAFVDLLYASSYPFGDGTGTPAQGEGPSNDVISNPNITWERTFEFNVGLDFSAFNNILSVSVDAYKAKTDQLLLQQSTMAFTGATKFWNNIGQVQNKGVEIEISTNNVRRKDFTWKTSANIAFAKNKLLQLGGEPYQWNNGERNEIYSAKVGQETIHFWGYKTDGVWLSAEQVNDAKSGKLVGNGNKNSNVFAAYFTPGQLKLKDIDGDSVITAADRTDIGKPFPDFTWGITNMLTYKAFDLSFSFQGVQGASVINGDAFYNETKRINKNYVNNRWVSAMFPGDGKTPYAIPPTGAVDWMLTDYVVQDASYFALREVILGYTLPSNLVSKAKLRGFRIYASAQNLWVHMAKGYKGINPEARYTSSQYANPLVDGYQRGGFPMIRSFIIGLDINF